MDTINLTANTTLSYRVTIISTIINYIVIRIKVYFFGLILLTYVEGIE